MGAFDNADYSQKSSLAGTDSSYYVSMVLFQDASEKPLAKITGSSTNARSKVSSSTQLPCQVISPYKNYLLDLPYFLKCCFHQKIVLLSIFILSSKKGS